MYMLNEFRGCSVIQKIDLELQGLPLKAEIPFIILSVPLESLNIIQLRTITAITLLTAS